MLGEIVTFTKLLGISFAVAAIFMFFLDNPHTRHTNKAKLGFYLVGMAALLRAGMGLSYKYAFMHGADRNSLLTINGTGAAAWGRGSGIAAGASKLHCHQRAWNFVS